MKPSSGSWLEAAMRPQMCKLGGSIYFLGSTLQESKNSSFSHTCSRWCSASHLLTGLLIFSLYDLHPASNIDNLMKLSAPVKACFPGIWAGAGGHVEGSLEIWNLKSFQHHFASLSPASLADTPSSSFQAPHYSEPVPAKFLATEPEAGITKSVRCSHACPPCLGRGSSPKMYLCFLYPPIAWYFSDPSLTRDPEMLLIIILQHE